MAVLRLHDLREQVNEHLAQNMHVHWIGVAAGTNTLTATYAPITAYADGLGVAFAVGVDSTSTTTLNVNGLGAIPIKKASGVYTLRYVSFITCLWLV